jgi:glutamine synthetase
VDSPFHGHARVCGSTSAIPGLGSLDEEAFEEGSRVSTAPRIRGWQAINESDMLVVPEPETAHASTRSPRLTDARR